jgi:anti-sigma factor RsiW
VKHPAETALSLYAASDLAWWRRPAVAHHLRACDGCQRRVDEFRALRGLLEAERDELPAGFDWGEAAAAMRANIRLGLAAGECVAPPPERARSLWRPALALPALLLVAAAWILQSIPPTLQRSPSPQAAAAGAVVLDAGPSGIGVERDGRGFRLMRPDAAGIVEVSVRGDSVRSRYVDAETGQVTISHVYAE